MDTTNTTNWNWFNVQAAAGGFLTMQDLLLMYVSGGNFVGCNTTANGCQRDSTGVASMRRDGFAGLDHLSHLDPAELMTRPLVWAVAATHLFVNFDGTNLTVALLDAATGEPIAPFTLENSVSLDASNSTRSVLAWHNEPSDGISQLRGRAVRILFRWGQRGDKGSSLYSFWVATSKCGASRGYVAGGGPGIGGDVDSKGSCA